MAERFDEQDVDWPQRPWIMAAIGALGGLIVHLLTDDYSYSTPMPVWKQAATAFTVVATISFLLTVELRRWTWAVAFAVGWGAVIALVGWFTAQYNRNGEIMEFPFLSGILAVLIAAPLFQTIRDEGAWRFPYARLHRHAWTDAVIGAASLAFTGVTFLLVLLIASLFDVIGIEAIKDLLEEEWFDWMLAGLAFGGALGILRERDALAATLQKLVMVVLSVLAPVLAVALAGFLLSLPFTGLKGLWESDIPATPMLLLSGAGAILLANAVIGDGREERSTSRWLQYAALVLILCILPLAVLAALSMGERINQYGWTPERIWGVIAVAIAIAYGIVAWWAVYKGRKDYDDQLRPLQTGLAIGLCGLALFLALPILDFGAISAKSQLARLESGKVEAEEFDWTAMAFDFGPEGRERLAEIARSGAANLRTLAKAALDSDNRWSLSEQTQSVAQRARIDQYLRLLSPDIVVTDALKAEITGYDGCNDRPCALLRVDAGHLLLVYQPHENSMVQSRVVDLANLGKGTKVAQPARTAPAKANLATANIEIRAVQRRQLYVDGHEVGLPFE
ncbi:MAG TPA: DUF4153 domain-containing protein [Sphingomicrobium sp.]|nr:DUF4153 domain-containing protein [Sphingomicrobium sp.]